MIRKPAQIAHVCDSDEIPARPGRAASRCGACCSCPMPPHGPGFPAAARRAHVFLGAARGAPFQTGRARHTPFPGTLQLDLGPVETVRASRQLLKKKPLPEAPARRIIPSSSSTIWPHARPHPVVEKAGDADAMEPRPFLAALHGNDPVLQFELTLPPQSAKTITYRLRLVERKADLKPTETPS
jgi:hypothetical protein